MVTVIGRQNLCKKKMGAASKRYDPHIQIGRFKEKVDIMMEENWFLSHLNVP